MRFLSFALLGVLVVWMMAATLVEKLYGTPFAVRYAYGSPLFAACWGVMAACAAAHLVRRKVQRRPAAMLLHGAFAVILLGAAVTRLWGVHGSLHLRQDAAAPAYGFATADGATHTLPFGLRLERFSVDYYPGTVAPMDYVSRLVVDDGGQTVEAAVSMNHIYSHRHYRFYQSKYDSDGQGTTLAVSYDPWGIGLTYAGYGLLLLSMALFFFDPHSRFRQLLHHPLLRRGAACLVLGLAGAAGMQAAEAPRALPRETAEAFGRLYVYYNDRICPLQTLAKDFTVKLCGRSTYKGLTPEQVLTGWFFYYDNWKEEPCIRIKSKEVRQLLGIGGVYARLADFVGRDGYKLGGALREGTGVADTRGVGEANEKFSLVSQVATGSIWRLYPYAEAGDSCAAAKRLAWYSLVDRPPAGMPAEQARFVRGCMNYVSEQVAKRDFRQVEELVGKLRKYQVREAGGFLPSDTRVAAERCYNRLNNSRPLAMASLALGLLAFVAYCRCMVRGRQMPRLVTRVLAVLLGALFLFLCFLLALRGVVGGHAPMSNGHETMQLMAACAALLTCCLHRRLPIALSFGFLLGGLALLVSMMGEANPPVTQLMPVLSSPLLSFHVMVIMAAYALLAFVMLNGVTALVVHASRKDRQEEVERLQLLGEVLLYPAVFLLAAGIFIGAVWANVSWGSYWSWDPKEVWALITLLIYSLALHPASLPVFRRPLFFHWFSVLAFFCVLITYFGVNFLLGGMHSYA